MLSVLLVLWMLHSITYDPSPPYPGALGLACHADFRAFEGHAQDRCPEGFEGIVLYDGAFRDEATLLNVIAHEEHHLLTDSLDEAGAYRAGCEASWIPQCLHWLAEHDGYRVTVAELR